MRARNAIVAAALMSIGALGVGMLDPLGDGEAQAPVVGDCVDPRSFGAVVNDELDDRAAIQAAIDEAKTLHRPVCLPPGTLHVSRRPGLGTTAIGSLQIVGVDGFEMRGVGPNSRIEMIGTAILSGGWTPANWWVIQLQGRDITLADFAIDGGRRIDTGEQTHLVQVVGQSGPVYLHDLVMDLPVLSPPAGSVPCKDTTPENDTRQCGRQRWGMAPIACKSIPGYPTCSVDPEGAYSVIGYFAGGDCIRTVGELETKVDGMSVTRVHARACARSFFAFQRATENVRITDNDVDSVPDQIVDQEPSGDGAIRDVVIAHNRFRRGINPQGGVAITLTGTADDQLAEGIVLDSNTIEGGGVMVSNVARSTITNNRIVGATVGAEAVVYVIKNGDGLKIVGNSITRPAGALPGPAVFVGHHDGAMSRGVLISGNDITNAANGPAIEGQSVAGARVVGNLIDCQQPLPITYDAVLFRGILQATDRLVVAGNDVRGACKRLVNVGVYGAVPIGSVAVTGNVTSGTTYGVEMAATPSIPPVVDGNVFGGVGATGRVRPVTLVYIGSNSGS